MGRGSGVHRVQRFVRDQRLAPETRSLDNRRTEFVLPRNTEQNGHYRAARDDQSVGRDTGNTLLRHHAGAAAREGTAELRAARAWHEKDERSFHWALLPGGYLQILRRYRGRGHRAQQ